MQLQYVHHTETLKTETEKKLKMKLESDSAVVGTEDVLPNTKWPNLRLGYNKLVFLANVYFLQFFIHAHCIQL